MKPRPRFCGPAGQAVISFLQLVAIIVVLELARRLGFVDLAFTQRAKGIAVGLMLVVVGNLLPKMRPFGAWGGDPATAAAAERLAGWVLVVTGLAYAALFLLAPVEQARSLSPILGLGGLALIAMDWAWLARSPRPAPGTEAGTRVRPGTEGRKVAFGLLFSIAYLLATTSLKYLSEGRSWAGLLATWSLPVFLLAYSVFLAAMDFHRDRT